VFLSGTLWYPRQDLHLIFHFRRVVCFSYTTGTFENWRPMPVMLRRDLIDNQAGCYYLNRANEMVVGVGIAPTSRRLQRHANLSQLTNRKAFGVGCPGW
jgi:hypothetical protein